MQIKRTLLIVAGLIACITCTRTLHAGEVRFWTVEEIYNVADVVVAVETVAARPTATTNYYLRVFPVHEKIASLKVHHVFKGNITGPRLNIRWDEATEGKPQERAPGLYEVLFLTFNRKTKEFSLLPISINDVYASFRLGYLSSLYIPESRDPIGSLVDILPGNLPRDHDTVERRMTLVPLTTQFRIRYHRWPASLDEFAAFAKRKPHLSFRKRDYSTLTFSPETNGVCVIRYALRWPRRRTGTARSVYHLNKKFIAQAEVKQSPGGDSK